MTTGVASLFLVPQALVVEARSSVGAAVSYFWSIIHRLHVDRPSVVVEQMNMRRQCCFWTCGPITHQTPCGLIVGFTDSVLQQL